MKACHGTSAMYNTNHDSRDDIIARLHFALTWLSKAMTTGRHRLEAWSERSRTSLSARPPVLALLSRRVSGLRGGGVTDVLQPQVQDEGLFYHEGGRKKKAVVHGVRCGNNRPGVEGSSQRIWWVRHETGTSTGSFLSAFLVYLCCSCSSRLLE